MGCGCALAVTGVPIGPPCPRETISQQSTEKVLCLRARVAILHTNKADRQIRGEGAVCNFPPGKGVAAAKGINLLGTSAPAGFMMRGGGDDMEEDHSGSKSKSGDDSDGEDDNMEDTSEEDAG
mmetsp:Transcript_45760/g.145861  ORF Transcript_45760/g.145861 Transcript_45760/m.145861 type:complete len:123 (+) Transcript_45760:3-371(+)